MTDEEMNVPGSAEEQAATEEPEGPAEVENAEMPEAPADVERPEGAPANEDEQQPEAEADGESSVADEAPADGAETATGDAAPEEAAPAGPVRLKHMFHSLDVILHQYSGRVIVKGGVAEIPLDHPEWARNAYVRGYRRDPETGEFVNFAEVLARFTHGL